MQPPFLGNTLRRFTPRYNKDCERIPLFSTVLILSLFVCVAYAVQPIRSLTIHRQSEALGATTLLTYSVTLYEPFSPLLGYGFPLYLRVGYDPTFQSPSFLNTTGNLGATAITCPSSGPHFCLRVSSYPDPSRPLAFKLNTQVTNPTSTSPVTTLYTLGISNKQDFSSFLAFTAPTNPPLLTAHPVCHGVELEPVVGGNVVINCTLSIPHSLPVASRLYIKLPSYMNATHLASAILHNVVSSNSYDNTTLAISNLPAQAPTANPMEFILPMLPKGSFSFILTGIAPDSSFVGLPLSLVLSVADVTSTETDNPLLPVIVLKEGTTGSFATFPPATLYAVTPSSGVYIDTSAMFDLSYTVPSMTSNFALGISLQGFDLSAASLLPTGTLPADIVYTSNEYIPSLKRRVAYFAGTLPTTSQITLMLTNVKTPSTYMEVKGRNIIQYLTDHAQTSLYAPSLAGPPDAYLFSVTSFRTGLTPLIAYQLSTIESPDVDLVLPASPMVAIMKGESLLNITLPPSISLISPDDILLVFYPNLAKSPSLSITQSATTLQAPNIPSLHLNTTLTALLSSDSPMRLRLRYLPRLPDAATVNVTLLSLAGDRQLHVAAWSYVVPQALSAPIPFPTATISFSSASPRTFSVTGNGYVITLTLSPSLPILSGTTIQVFLPSTHTDTGSGSATMTFTADDRLTPTPSTYVVDASGASTTLSCPVPIDATRSLQFEIAPRFTISHVEGQIYNTSAIIRLVGLNDTVLYQTNLTLPTPLPTTLQGTATFSPTEPFMNATLTFAPLNIAGLYPGTSLDFILGVPFFNARLDVASPTVTLMVDNVAQWIDDPSPIIPLPNYKYLRFSVTEFTSSVLSVSFPDYKSAGAGSPNLVYLDIVTPENTHVASIKYTVTTVVPATNFSLDATLSTTYAGDPAALTLKARNHPSILSSPGSVVAFLPTVYFDTSLEPIPLVVQQLATYSSSGAIVGVAVTNFTVHLHNNPTVNWLASFSADGALTIQRNVHLPAWLASASPQSPISNLTLYVANINFNSTVPRDSNLTLTVRQAIAQFHPMSLYSTELAISDGQGVYSYAYTSMPIIKFGSFRVLSAAFTPIPPATQVVTSDTAILTFVLDFGTVIAPVLPLPGPQTPDLEIHIPQTYGGYFKTTPSVTYYLGDSSIGISVPTTLQGETNIHTRPSVSLTGVVTVVINNVTVQSSVPIYPSMGIVWLPYAPGNALSSSGMPPLPAVTPGPTAPPTPITSVTTSRSTNIPRTNDIFTINLAFPPTFDLNGAGALVIDLPQGSYVSLSEAVSLGTSHTITNAILTGPDAFAQAIPMRIQGTTLIMSCPIVVSSGDKIISITITEVLSPSPNVLNGAPGNVTLYSATPAAGYVTGTSLANLYAALGKVRATSIGTLTIPGSNWIVPTSVTYSTGLPDRYTQTTINVTITFNTVWYNTRDALFLRAPAHFANYTSLRTYVDGQLYSSSVIYIEHITNAFSTDFGSVYLGIAMNLPSPTLTPNKPISIILGVTTMPYQYPNLEIGVRTRTAQGGWYPIVSSAYTSMPSILAPRVLSTTLSLDNSTVGALTNLSLLVPWPGSAPFLDYNTDIFRFTLPPGWFTTSPLPFSVHYRDASLGPSSPFQQLHTSTVTPTNGTFLDISLANVASKRPIGWVSNTENPADLLFIIQCTVPSPSVSRLGVAFEVRKSSNPTPFPHAFAVPQIPLDGMIKLASPPLSLPTPPRTLSSTASIYLSSQVDSALSSLVLSMLMPATYLQSSQPFAIHQTDKLLLTLPSHVSILSKSAYLIVSSSSSISNLVTISASSIPLGLTVRAPSSPYPTTLVMSFNQSSSSSIDCANQYVHVVIPRVVVLGRFSRTSDCLTHSFLNTTQLLSSADNNHPNSQVASINTPMALVQCTPYVASVDIQAADDTTYFTAPYVPLPLIYRIPLTSSSLLSQPFASPVPTSFSSSSSPALSVPLASLGSRTPGMVTSLTIRVPMPLDFVLTNYHHIQLEIPSGYLDPDTAMFTLSFNNTVAGTVQSVPLNSSFTLLTNNNDQITQVFNLYISAQYPSSTFHYPSLISVNDPFPFSLPLSIRVDNLTVPSPGNLSTVADIAVMITHTGKVITQSPVFFYDDTTAAILPGLPTPLAFPLPALVIRPTSPIFRTLTDYLVQFTSSLPLPLSTQLTFALPPTFNCTATPSLLSASINESFQITNISALVSKLTPTLGGNDTCSFSIRFTRPVNKSSIVSLMIEGIVNPTSSPSGTNAPVLVPLTQSLVSLSASSPLGVPLFTTTHTTVITSFPPIGPYLKYIPLLPSLNMALPFPYQHARTTLIITLSTPFALPSSSLIRLHYPDTLQLNYSSVNVDVLLSDIHGASPLPPSVPPQPALFRRIIPATSDFPYLTVDFSLRAGQSVAGPFQLNLNGVLTPAPGRNLTNHTAFITIIDEVAFNSSSFAGQTLTGPVDKMPLLQFALASSVPQNDPIVIEELKCAFDVINTTFSQDYTTIEMVVAKNVTLTRYYEQGIDLMNYSIPIHCAEVLIPTSLSKIGSNPSCSIIRTTALIPSTDFSSSSLVNTTTSMLRIDLGLGATLLPQNDSLGLVNGSLSSLTGDILTINAYCSLNHTVSPSPLPYPSIPLAIHTQLSLYGLCDGIRFLLTSNALYSLRPLTFTYSLVDYPPTMSLVNVTLVNQALAALPMNTTDFTLPLNKTLEAGTYTVQVKATSWFGSVAVFNGTALRVAGLVPRVSVVGSDTIASYISKDVLVSFQTARGFCSNTQSGSSLNSSTVTGLTHTWTVTPPPPSDSPLAALVTLYQGRKELRIPAYTIPINSTYNFTITVIDVSLPQVPVTASIMVSIVSSPLLSVITGSSSRTISVSSKVADPKNASHIPDPAPTDIMITLDGSKGGDPDVDRTLASLSLRYANRRVMPPTLSDDAVKYMENVTYTWQCWEVPKATHLDTQSTPTSLSDLFPQCPIQSNAIQAGLPPPSLSGMGANFSTLTLPRASLSVNTNLTRNDSWVFILSTSTVDGRITHSELVFLTTVREVVPVINIDVIGSGYTPPNPQAFLQHTSLTLVASVSYDGILVPKGLKHVIIPITGTLMALSNLTFEWTTEGNNFPFEDPTLRRTDTVSPYLTLKPYALRAGTLYSFSVKVTATSPVLLGSPTGDYTLASMLSSTSATATFSFISTSSPMSSSPSSLPPTPLSPTLDEPTNTFSLLADGDPVSATSLLPIFVASPPHGGTCSATSDSGPDSQGFYDFASMVTIGCSGWTVPTTGPISYRFALRTIEPHVNVSFPENDASILPPGFIPLTSYQLGQSVSVRVPGSDDHLDLLIHIRDGSTGAIAITNLTLNVRKYEPDESIVDVSSSLVGDLRAGVATGDQASVTSSLLLATQVVEAATPAVNIDEIFNGTDPRLVTIRTSVIDVLTNFTQSDSFNASDDNAQVVIFAASVVSSAALQLTSESRSLVAGMVSTSLDQFQDKPETFTPVQGAAVISSLSNLLTSSAVSSLVDEDPTGDQVGEAVDSILQTVSALLLNGATPGEEPLTINSNQIQHRSQRLLPSDLADTQRLSLDSYWEGTPQEIELITSKLKDNSTLGVTAEPQRGKQLNISLPPAIVNQSATTSDTAIEIHATVVNKNLFSNQDNGTSTFSLSQILSISIGQASLSTLQSEGKMAVHGLPPGNRIRLSFPHAPTNGTQYTTASEKAADELAKELAANASKSNTTVPEGTILAQKVPVCRYWDEVREIWSSEGCYVVTALTTQDTTVCECDHLTVFSAAMNVLPLFIPKINTLDADDFKRVTWANIVAHPASFIAICVMFGLFFILFPLAYYRDKAAETELVKETVATMVLMAKEGVQFPSKERERLKERTAMITGTTCGKIVFATRLGLQQHLWTSVLFRSRRSAFESRDRLMVITTLVFGTLTLTAVFNAQQSAYQQITVSIISAVASGLVTGGIAYLFMGESPVYNWVLSMFVRQYAMLKIIDANIAASRDEETTKALIRSTSELYRLRSKQELEANVDRRLNLTYINVRKPVSNVNESGEAELVPMSSLSEKARKELNEIANKERSRFEKTWKKRWEEMYDEGVHSRLEKEFNSGVHKGCFKARGAILGKLLDKYRDEIPLQVVLKCMYSSAFWFAIERLTPEAIATSYSNRPFSDRWPRSRIAGYVISSLLILTCGMLILVYGLKFDMEGYSSAEDWLLGVLYANLLDAFGSKPMSLLFEAVIIYLLVRFCCLPRMEYYAEREQQFNDEILQNQLRSLAVALANDPFVDRRIVERVSRAVPIAQRKDFAAHVRQEMIKVEETKEKAKLTKREKKLKGKLGTTNDEDGDPLAITLSSPVSPTSSSRTLEEQKDGNGISSVDKASLKKRKEKGGEDGDGSDNEVVDVLTLGKILKSEDLGSLLGPRPGQGKGSSLDDVVDRGERYLADLVAEISGDTEFMKEYHKLRSLDPLTPKATGGKFWREQARRLDDIDERLLKEIIDEKRGLKASRAINDAEAWRTGNINAIPLDEVGDEGIELLELRAKRKAELKKQVEARRTFDPLLEPQEKEHLGDEEVGDEEKGYGSLGRETSVEGQLGRESEKVEDVEEKSGKHRRGPSKMQTDFLASIGLDFGLHEDEDDFMALSASARSPTEVELADLDVSDSYSGRGNEKNRGKKSKITDSVRSSKGKRITDIIENGRANQGVGVSAGGGEEEEEGGRNPAGFDFSDMVLSRRGSTTGDALSSAFGDSDAFVIATSPRSVTRIASPTASTSPRPLSQPKGPTAFFPAPSSTSASSPPSSSPPSSSTLASSITSTSTRRTSPTAKVVRFHSTASDMNAKVGPDQIPQTNPAQSTATSSSTIPLPPSNKASSSSSSSSSSSTDTSASLHPRRSLSPSSFTTTTTTTTTNSSRPSHRRSRSSHQATDSTFNRSSDILPPRSTTPTPTVSDDHASSSTHRSNTFGRVRPSNLAISVNTEDSHGRISSIVEAEDESRTPAVNPRRLRPSPSPSPSRSNPNSSPETVPTINNPSLDLLPRSSSGQSELAAMPKRSISPSSSVSSAHSTHSTQSTTSNRSTTSSHRAFVSPTARRLNIKFFYSDDKSTNTSSDPKK